jgi:serine/threonine protein kinase
MFCREALVWQRLNHPSVLPFLGVDAETFSPLLCMVSPWMSHGTIQKYIKHMGIFNVDHHKFVSLKYDNPLGLMYPTDKFFHFRFRKLRMV